MKTKKTCLIAGLIAVACLVVGVFAGMTVRMREVGHTGTVKFVGDFNVFADDICSVPLVTVDWPQLNRGGTYSKTYWIKNTGTTDADTMYIFWNVTGLPSGFTFTMEWDGSLWNPNVKKPLAPDVSKPIKMIMTLASNVPAQTFGYTQWFTGDDFS
jgi:hypothetical protein